MDELEASTDTIQSRINRIAAEAKQRNPEGLQGYKSNYKGMGLEGNSEASTSSDEEKSNLMGTFVNPESGQKFSLLATTVNVPLHLQELA